jgi:hypothetical protein
LIVLFPWVVYSLSLSLSPISFISLWVHEIMCSTSRFHQRASSVTIFSFDARHCLSWIPMIITYIANLELRLTPESKTSAISFFFILDPWSTLVHVATELPSPHPPMV